MALRADFDLKNALIKRFVVKSGTTVTVGARIKFGSSDTEVDLASANDDLAFGTALEAGVGNSAGTVLVDVCLDGHCVVPMVVGTGGSTRGKKQKGVSDGVTDADTNGGGTTAHATIGIAMQSGSAGDVIGVMPANGRYVASA